MQRHISRHAVAVCQLGSKAHGQRLAGGQRNLSGQPDDKLTHQDSIPALMVLLDPVPQLGAGHGAAAWQHDFRVQDAALVRVVMDLARSLVLDSLTSAIRGGGGRAAPGGATDCLS